MTSRLNITRSATPKTVQLEELRKVHITLRRKAHPAVGAELLALKQEIREVEVLILQVKKGA